MKKMYKPEPLQRGDRVALIAPSSPVDRNELEIARRSLEFLELEPVIYRSCYERHGYLSGADAIRVQDLNDAFSDARIKGIVCIRGGYGSARLLPLIDFHNIKSHPKVFLGYSDITALHTAINNICGMITYHGPMPSHPYYELDDYTLDSLKVCLFGASDKSISCTRHMRPCETRHQISNPPEYTPHTIYAGFAQGILTGGNLSLLTSTLGSDYEVDTKGKILLIEDTGEEIYRIDRMLTTLSLAGKFDDCTGIVIGTFSKIKAPSRDTLSIERVFDEIILPKRKPAIYNFCSGHSYPQATLPLGAVAFLDADTGILSIE